MDSKIINPFPPWSSNHTGQPTVRSQQKGSVDVLFVMREGRKRIEVGFLLGITS
jgi:hypothetical protein